jgi:hypothetical protein
MFVRVLRVDFAPMERTRPAVMDRGAMTYLPHNGAQPVW